MKLGYFILMHCYSSTLFFGWNLNTFALNKLLLVVLKMNYAIMIINILTYLKKKNNSITFWN